MIHSNPIEQKGFVTRLVMYDGSDDADGCNVVEWQRAKGVVPAMSE